MASMLQHFSKHLSKGLRTGAAVALLTVASYAAAQGVRGDHPDTYVVQRGDTLWDISAKFLQKPWLWPEIWQANPQIQNPHLIYPGDVVSLAYLNRVTTTPGPRAQQAQPITGVPLSEVEPFLKNLRVVDSFDHLPHVAGLEDNRLRSTNGQLIYVRGNLPDATPGTRYAIVRPTAIYAESKPNTDLDFRGEHIRGEGTLWKNYIPPNERSERLGYELAQQAVGVLTRGLHAGVEASTLVLEGKGLEVRIGDRLIPVEAQPYDLQFFPHPPSAQAADGKLRVLGVADGYTTSGPRHVIAISGGSREGIDNGTVLSVWRQGSHVRNAMRYPNSSRIDDALASGAGRVSLPDEYAAHVMIFRTFDKVSYGLVMEGVKPVRLGYELKHPDAAY